MPGNLNGNFNDDGFCSAGRIHVQTSTIYHEENSARSRISFFPKCIQTMRIAEHLDRKLHIPSGRRTLPYHPNRDISLLPQKNPVPRTPIPIAPCKAPCVYTATAAVPSVLRHKFAPRITDRVSPGILQRAPAYGRTGLNRLRAVRPRIQRATSTGSRRVQSRGWIPRLKGGNSCLKE